MNITDISKYIVVDEQEINGTLCVITVSKNGMFTVRDDEDLTVQYGHGNEFDKARMMASSKLSQQKVRVNVHFRDRKTLRLGTATSIHGRTNKIMVRMNGSRKTEQLDSYARVVQADMPKEDRERMLKLDTDIRALDKERDTLYRKYQMNLGEAVREAIKLATGEDE